MTRRRRLVLAIGIAVTGSCGKATTTGTTAASKMTFTVSSSCGAPRSWKSWHILVPPSGVIDISDASYAACHGAYSFLP